MPGCLYVNRRLMHQSLDQGPEVRPEIPAFQALEFGGSLIPQESSPPMARSSAPPGTYSEFSMRQSLPQRSAKMKQRKVVLSPTAAPTREACPSSSPLQRSAPTHFGDGCHRARRWRASTLQTKWLILPEILEAARCQLGIADGVLNVLVAQIKLDRP